LATSRTDRSHYEKPVPESGKATIDLPAASLIEGDTFMSKRTMVFAPASYNLAETTRMLEIARASRDDFRIVFISEGGRFEHLIEDEGFELIKMSPRLTDEKIEHLYKVDKGEKLGYMFTVAEIREKLAEEIRVLNELKPVAIVTGFYLTVSLSARITRTPLVYVIQSTWLPQFFKSGMGMTDGITSRFLKSLANALIYRLLTVFSRIAVISPFNKVAKEYGIKGFKGIDEFFSGDYVFMAEPDEFSGIMDVPGNYFYTGPLIARESYPVPEAVKNIPRDQPVVYFAMGSSATPEIMANIILGFEGMPWRIITPAKAHIEKLHIEVPDNVIVTDWLPAHEVNPMADISVIHGGIGTVMTAALAGKPVVGIGMQPEQDANIQCLVRKGIGIRIPKSKQPSRAINAAIERLLHDETAKQKAREFGAYMAQWDGPALSAKKLRELFAPSIKEE
jgi:UDP:flavonoid glycosyltransferase YjiC (YdhE family)